MSETRNVYNVNFLLGPTLYTCMYTFCVAIYTHI